MANKKKLLFDNFPPKLSSVQIEFWGRRKCAQKGNKLAQKNKLGLAGDEANFIGRN